MYCRGVRGATTVTGNSREAILEATRELLERMVEANGIAPADVASALFTVTSELDAAFPAAATRDMEGWKHVPLLNAKEIPVPGSLPRCIRVLLTWNTARPQEEVVHVYLHDAVRLRPDLLDS